MPKAGTDPLLNNSAAPDFSYVAAERDEAIHAAERHLVARVTAANSVDAKDAKLILDMLGIDPAEGLSETKRSTVAA